MDFSCSSLDNSCLLGDASIVKRPNKQELSNEEHEKSIVNFRQRSFRFRHKFFFLGFNLISIHVISLLRWKWISFNVILSVVGLGVVVLTLVRCDNHENSSCDDRYNANVKPTRKEN